MILSHVILSFVGNIGSHSGIYSIGSGSIENRLMDWFDLVFVW